MTSAEKWNLIVDNYKHLYSSLESKLQTEWEMYCAELLGYKKLLHEIDFQKHLSVGSGGSIIPDIILRISQKDIFDIELKQYNLPFNETFESQLISYLNQTHLSVGMIVCNKIYLYYYEYSTVTVNKIEIPFEKDNSDGIALIEMLTKESFSDQTIKNYVLNKLKHENDLVEIKNILTNDWIKSAVKEKLLEKYSETDIDSILKQYSFRVNPVVKDHPNITPASPISVTNAPHVAANLDILSLIHNWCIEKSKMGELNFLQNSSTKKYTRFTTDDLDELLPCQSSRDSGWKNGHFYTYEIINQDGKFKMWLVFSNTNAPDSCRDVFKKVMNATGSRPQKENWQWWGIFSTKPFAYNTLTTPEEIYSALDSQFAQVRANVAILLKNM